MIPLRAVAEAFGAEVKWNDPYILIKGPASSKNTNVWMNLEIGSNTISYTHFNEDYTEEMSDGFHIYLDSPPVLVNDRTLVPIRAIAEVFQYSVDWD